MKIKETKKITVEVINEIESVKKECGLTPENLLEKAKHKKNPLHDLFEWNDSLAAHRYRLQQARVLINEIKVIIEDKEYYLYENVKVEIGDSDDTDREYKNCFEIKDDDDLRQQMIAKAIKELAYWKEKHKFYSDELKGLFREIEKVERKYTKISAQV
jgi:hypothetical protein